MFVKKKVRFIAYIVDCKFNCLYYSIRGKPYSTPALPSGMSYCGAAYPAHSQGTARYGSILYRRNAYTAISLPAFKKLRHTVFFHHVQVINHAHVIFRTIALVQCFNVCARIMITLIAKPHLSVLKQRTPVAHMKTALAARQTSSQYFL